MDASKSTSPSRKLFSRISRGGDRSKSLNRVFGLAEKEVYRQQSTRRRMFCLRWWWEPYRRGRTEEERCVVSMGRKGKRIVVAMQKFPTCCHSWHFACCRKTPEKGFTIAKIGDAQLLSRGFSQYVPQETRSQARSVSSWK